MPTYDNLHSRIVARLKVILPLSALALLSSVFLVARQGEFERTIPYSATDLEEMASEQSVQEPVYSSVTEEGRHLVVTAATATPRDGNYNVVDAVEVHGVLEEVDGDTLDIRSETGTIFTKRSQTILRGNVRIETSTGYRLNTEELVSSMDRTDIKSPGPVHGDGPLGTIEAGRMEVSSELSADGSEEEVTVVFKDGVKVIYTPKTK